MKMKKILIVLGIIIAILVMIVLVHTIRNYIIITDLQNKIAKYSISTNYYVKSVTKENDGTVSTIEDYKKDNKQATFLERKQKEESTKVSIYYDGSSTDTFSETKDTKIAELDNSSIMSVDIYNNLETDNKWQTLLGCIMSSQYTLKSDS